MTDTVLYIATQFGKSVLVTLWYKDGVVAETTLTPTFFDDSATHYAFK